MTLWKAHVLNNKSCKETRLKTCNRLFKYRADVNLGTHLVQRNRFYLLLQQPALVQEWLTRQIKALTLGWAVYSTSSVHLGHFTKAGMYCYSYFTAKEKLPKVTKEGQKLISATTTVIPMLCPLSHNVWASQSEVLSKHLTHFSTNLWAFTVLCLLNRIHLG